MLLHKSEPSADKRISGYSTTWQVPGPGGELDFPQL